MYRTLVWKELRAAWPYAAVVLLAQLALCNNRVEVAPLEPISIFEETEMLLILKMLAIGFGVFLGLFQTVPESVLGTAAFAFQTARCRTAIVWAKLTAGLSLFSLALLVPLLVTVAMIVGRSTYFIPLTWTDARYLWVILWAGTASYIGTLAMGLRGGFSSEGGRQLAGGVVVGLGVFLGLASPFLSEAVFLLGLTTVVGLGWAWTGFAAREFR